MTSDKLQELYPITVNELLVTGKIIGMLSELAAKQIHDKLFPDEELTIDEIHLLVAKVCMEAQEKVLAYSEETIEEYLKKHAEAKVKAVESGQANILALDLNQTIDLN